ncbi:MAG: sigma-70 family RNA polymerase sigma factor [Firmicutes bacterium]|nr:sigma-70 family RNA polymerase sigma factor [Bacillota bacterium]
MSRLPPQAQAELWRRARRGDAGARAQLATAHLGLARAVAARFGDAPPGRGDLMQAAALGLVQAVAAYDPEAGVPFAAFAVPRILGEVRETMRRAGGFGAPRRLAQEAARLAEARRRLAALLGREPRLDELARELGRTSAELADVVAALAPPAPVEAAAHLAGRGPTPEEAVVDRLAVAGALAELAPLERRVVALRVLGGLTQQAVARLTGMSQSQVSRRERAGLRRLWRSLAAARADLGKAAAIHTDPGGEAT